MTREIHWYSTQLRLAAIVETLGVRHYMDVVHVFRARDWEDARERAVALGRGHEQAYENEEGRAVRWVLKEVLTLDLLPAGDPDGAEVHSRLADADPADAGGPYSPEHSVPVQTVF